MTERPGLDAEATAGPCRRGRRRHAPGLPAQRGRPDRLRRGVPAPARTAPAAHALAGPRRAQGRSPERQARPVGRVRGLSRLRARRRPAPARLERLRPPRAALREALRRGGGRHGDAPHRRLGVDGDAGTREKLLFAKRAAAALGYIGLASEDRVAVSALVGADGAPAGGPARQRPGLPAAGRPVRHRAGRRARPISWPPPATPRPSSTAAASWSSSPTCSTRPPTGSSASSPRPAPS